MRRCELRFHFVRSPGEATGLLDPGTETPAAEVATEAPAADAPLPEIEQTANVSGQTAQVAEQPAGEVAPEATAEQTAAKAQAAANPAGTAPATAEAATPEVSELETLRKRVEELTGLLDRKNKHEREVRKAEAHVAELESELASLAEQQKNLKKEHDKAVTELRFQVRRKEDNSKGQKLIDLPEEPVQQNVQQKDANCQSGEKKDDTHGATLLRDIGVTEANCEKLATKEVTTVAQLEAFIAAGQFVPKVITGLGNTAIEKISDKLIAFRAKHPNPNQPQPELIDGKHEPAAYKAGQIARADGKPESDNPNKKGLLKMSWAAGWTAENAKLGTETSSTGEAVVAMNVEQAIAEANALKELCDKAGEEFTPTKNRIEAIAAFIAEKQAVTADQVGLLKQWRESLDRAVSQPVPGPETEAPAGESASSVRDALDMGEKILSLCDNVEAGEGQDFATSIAEECKSMCQWIESNNHVTEDQRAALANWLEGIEKWQPRGPE